MRRSERRFATKNRGESLEYPHLELKTRRIPKRCNSCVILHTSVKTRLCMFLKDVMSGVSPLSHAWASHNTADGREQSNPPHRKEQDRAPSCRQSVSWDDYRCPGVRLVVVRLSRESLSPSPRRLSLQRCSATPTVNIETASSVSTRQVALTGDSPAFCTKGVCVKEIGISSTSTV